MLALDNFTTLCIAKVLREKVRFRLPQNSSERAFVMKEIERIQQHDPESLYATYSEGLGSTRHSNAAIRKLAILAFRHHVICRAEGLDHNGRTLKPSYIWFKYSRLQLRMLCSD